jgi:ribosomal protein L40E
VTCPSCGTGNTPGANFCRSCGTSLDGRDRTEAMSPRPVVASDAATDPDDDPTDPDPVRTPGGAATADLQVCSRCGAGNSPRRVLCGRCGADLHAGVALPAPPRSHGRPAPGTDADGRRRRAARWTALAVVTAAAILGGGIGAMVALGVGPFAPDEGPPRAVFAPADYPGEPVDLVGGGLEVGASSRHEPVGDRRFEPQLMFDGDLTTAWNNSGETNPQGIGEQIVVDFPAPVWLTEIIVGNGDQRDDSRYLGTARLREARVALDAGQVFTITLLDVQGRQSIRLPVPRLTTGVTIQVVEAHPGDRVPELGVSELGFRGHVADEADAALAERRARFPRRLPEP